jgi:hypothetical protein
MVAEPIRECYNAPSVGAWRSLVARFNGVEEVVGSNPAAPTRRRIKRRATMRGVSVYCL